MVKARKKKRAQKAEKGVIYAFKNGSTATRLSFFMMGVGQLMRGQIAKGVVYLILQIAFTLFLSFFGGRYIIQLFSGNLGTRLSGEQWNEELQIFEKIKGDNSFLILLYGVASILIGILFMLLWKANAA